VSGLARLVAMVGLLGMLITMLAPVVFAVSMVWAYASGALH